MPLEEYKKQAEAKKAEETPELQAKRKLAYMIILGVVAVDALLLLLWFIFMRK